MSKKHFLALPVTGDTFAEIREKNRYYVDKTPYLKQVFSEDEAVDENSLIDGTVIVQLVCDITFIFVNNLTFSFFKKKRGCGGEKETFFFTLPFASFPYQPLQIHCCPF